MIEILTGLCYYFFMGSWGGRAVGPVKGGGVQPLGPATEESNTVRATLEEERPAGLRYL